MNVLFEYFLNNYLDGEQLDNKEKGYHQVLVNKIPDYIRQITGDKYKVKGSCGASNKAEIPWIGVFNPNITTTAQYGIYIVYLFKADMSGFYLCLGQGITNFEKYGRSKDEIMYKVADYYKEKITSNFSKDEIQLLSITSNGKGYEKVNILNKYYSKELINTYNFEQDLMEMLEIYDELSREMKYQTYDDVIENLISNTDPNYIMEKDAVNILEQELLESSELEEAEIITLKLSDIPEGRKTSKFSEMSKKTIRKIDYVKKQKKNAENGLIGEKLVMSYEAEKLRSLGKEELIEKIKWISKEDDGTGYDILSFDENGNEIYIEVKSTADNENAVFFISTNEINAMEKLKEKYFVYRVFNVKSKNPLVFILNYNDFKSKVELRIEGYTATVRGE